jgi:PAS domain S-box-containing protein
MSALPNMPENDDRVLIFAPTGQDASLMTRVLREGGIRSQSCPTFDSVFSEMPSGAGAVIVAEEGLNQKALDRLAEYLCSQPWWSDFPLILLTITGHVSSLQRRLTQTQKRLGNVLLLERPIRPETLISTVNGVLRSRQRQYQARDYLAEKLRSENALRESEKQFRDLANTIPQLAWIARADGYIFWYNERWFDYTGATQEDMEGWGWTALHDPAVLPEVMKRWTRAINLGESFEMTFPMRGADGKFRPFLTLVRPVRDASGRVVRWFGTNTDVSTQKRAEEALIRTEKLATAGRLAASVSHEINNPLEAITNLIYLVETSPRLDEQNRQLLQTAQAELQRVSHITTHSLRFYREPTKAAPIKLSAIIDSVVSLYQARLKQCGVEVKLRSRDECEYVGFSGELRQVLANLIGNALDAMRHGGQLQIRVHRSRDFSTGYLGLRLIVADSGHGMSPETRRCVFEPFFTTKESVGTGLGLFVSKELVEKRGGTIKLRSSDRPGRSGTTFSIFLPMHSHLSVSQSAGHQLQPAEQDAGAA